MKIVGVMLLKDEDAYCEQAARNVREFCDEIIVIDNGSTDGTRAAVQAAGVDRIITETDLTKTHEIVTPYCGTDTWVFGVDGDELYDPAGLRSLREDMEGGAYDVAYQIKGLYFHVVAFAEELGEAVGHMGPPSHNPTKLYNFARIQWPADGTHILFQSRPRFTEGVLANLCAGWDDAKLRCLHMRFLRRSSTEDMATVGKRLHGEDRLGFGSRTERDGKGGNLRPSYKRGPIRHTRTEPFFGGKQ